MALHLSHIDNLRQLHLAGAIVGAAACLATFLACGRILWRFIIDSLVVFVTYKHETIKYVLNSFAADTTAATSCFA